MKKILAFGCLLLAFGCGGNSQEPKTDEGLDVKDVRVLDPQSKISGCYTAVLNRDTANFVVQNTEDEQSVFADLEYLNHEKDGSRGSFNGKIQDSLLIGFYKYFSEGTTSVAQAVFKVQGDTLYQGYGDLIQKGDTTMFKEIRDLQFLTEKPFVKRDCQ